MSDKKQFKNENLYQSFYHALSGIMTIVKEERNMRIHLVAGLIVIAMGFAFGLNRSEWLWILLVVFTVWILETLNSTIEALVDLVTDSYHELAKIAKDMAAGMVLLGAILAIIVGALIFGPKVMALFI